MTDRDRADALLARFAEPYLAEPGVSCGRMFSSTGLSVRGKIFAVVNHSGNLMVKVSEALATWTRSRRADHPALLTVR